MNIGIPCRASADLRVHQREQERAIENEPSARELEDAKEDLAWRLLCDDVKLADILDGALNAQGSDGLADLSKRLAQLNSAIGGQRVEAICDLEQWTRAVVDGYLVSHPDMIRERALELR